MRYYSLLLGTSRKAVSLFLVLPLAIISCLPCICVGEGEHLTRVFQRCWPQVERGHPAPPHNSAEHERRSVGPREFSARLWRRGYISCRSGIGLWWYWVSSSRLLRVYLLGVSLNRILVFFGYLRVSSSSLLGYSGRVSSIFVSGGVIYASGGTLVSAADLYLQYNFLCLQHLLIGLSSGEL